MEKWCYILTIPNSQLSPPSLSSAPRDQVLYCQVFLSFTHSSWVSLSTSLHRSIFPMLLHAYYSRVVLFFGYLIWFFSSNFLSPIQSPPLLTKVDKSFHYRPCQHYDLREKLGLRRIRCSAQERQMHWYNMSVLVITNGQQYVRRITWKNKLKRITYENRQKWKQQILEMVNTKIDDQAKHMMGCHAEKGLSNPYKQREQIDDNDSGYLCVYIHQQCLQDWTAIVAVYKKKALYPY